MGKLILLSNFGDGYLEVVKRIIKKNNFVLSYIPSRTELGEIYYLRIKKSYKDIGVEKFQYIDIDNNYEEDYEEDILNSDVVFLAGGDDPYIIKNLKAHNYDVLLKKFYDDGGIIIGLCAGASILSQYSIVSDYDGIKFDKINVIPWGLNINDYMYYSRFDETCDLDNLKEFSREYGKIIIAASLDSIIWIIDGKVNVNGKALLINGDIVTNIEGDKL